MKKIILITICSIAIVSAQYNPAFSGLQTALPDSNNAALKFERNVNTYLWNANLHYSFKDSDLYLNTLGNANSSFIRKPLVSFRDEQKFFLQAGKQISPQLKLTSEVQSFFLSDSHSLGSSTAGIHNGVIGASYLPASFISITPSLGVRYDNQLSEKDEGPNYRLSAIADSLEFGGYHSQFSGRINQSDLGRRYFKNDGMEMNIATQFSEGSSDSISFRWLNNRNDFFVPIPAEDSIRTKFGVTSNIRSRTDRQWGVQNVLNYDINSKLGIYFTTNVDSRIISNKFRYKNLSDVASIPFNTDVQEFGLNGVIDMLYRSDALFAMFGAEISERDEKHLLERIEGVNTFEQDSRAQDESQLNNTAFRRSIHTTINSTIGAADVVVFSGSAGILQYDTPDSTNTDDRDELLINTSLREIHRFSDAYTFSLDAELTLAHIVYLKRFKSANNNWNRIFRLQPEMIYQPSQRFRMVNSFEVLANYTVFDFETIVPSVQSYSYRQVAFHDSTSYDITPNVGMDIFTSVRIFERGEFHWQEFSERPLQRQEEVTFSPQLRYNFKHEWFFAVGFRSFAQKKFSYTNNIRKLDNTYLSAGPTTRIMIRLSSSSLIEIFGWKEFQRQTGGRIQEYSNMTMNVKYLF